MSFSSVPVSPPHLGLHWIDPQQIDGTHRATFAVHAPDATAVWFCAVADDGTETRIPLRRSAFGVHYDEVTIAPGTRYGIRADGPWAPARGLRFNPAKILLDPYARRIVGDIGDESALRGYDGDDPFGERSDRDSLGNAPLAVATEFPVAAAVGPRAPWSQTVIYELRVGSFTATHPAVPPAHRGTYLGLTAPAVLDHLERLGVTSVELLPVQAEITEPSVRRRDMTNLWGYSTAAYFAPDPRYASAPGNELAEFAALVQALHARGIEVLLDVVYNHTAEVEVSGPHLMFRGLDPHGYYLLDGEGTDIDLTGCGDTVNAASSATVTLICDSLRYWVQQFGVDGFRFDLASALARGRGDFDAAAPLLRAIEQDPVLRTVKIIAEPWDATAGGYQLGNFGDRWAEWNDRYRDTVRRFFIGEATTGEFATRVCGSQDIFGTPGRGPASSVNFVTAHDGFTLRDLVSYSHKHNAANGENNNDGTDNNYSVNYGVEGPSDDPTVRAQRAQHQRALLATLLLSSGTPMLLAGDEIGHSQGGNNNAYCAPRTAEHPFAVDWSSADGDLTDFVALLSAMRAESQMLRRSTFFGTAEHKHSGTAEHKHSGTADPTGTTEPSDSDPAANPLPLSSAGAEQAPVPDTQTEADELRWYNTAGDIQTAEQWQDPHVRSVGVWASDVRDGLSALIYLHGGGDTSAVIPHVPEASDTWVVSLDSATPAASGNRYAAGDVVTLSGPTVLVLTEVAAAT